MDEQVLRGIAKWPNVPAVYGWLALDRRGEWRLKGDPIANRTVVSFINRNYGRDAEGRWFFQNGPQRVYVSLELTPHVYRVTSGEHGPLTLEAHTGEAVASVNAAWLDETGALYLEAAPGFGVVDDRDLEAILRALVDANANPLPDASLEEASALLQAGRDAAVWLKIGDSTVPVKPLQSGVIATRFGFDPSPQERG